MDVHGLPHNLVALPRLSNDNLFHCIKILNDIKTTNINQDNTIVCQMAKEEKGFWNTWFVSINLLKIRHVDDNQYIDFFY